MSTNPYTTLAGWARLAAISGLAGRPRERRRRVKSSAPSRLIAKVLPLERRFFALAERYVNAAAAEVSNLARALFLHHPHFFTFVHEEGVEPTKHRGEIHYERTRLRPTSRAGPLPRTPRRDTLPRRL